MKIGGQDLFVSHTGVGLTPTISWDAPSIGTPTSYFVAVFRVDANGADTKTTVVADLVTTGTQIQIPPNVLTDGSTFVLTISAVANAKATSKTPLESEIPDASAIAVTATFKP
jgi:hypothetical protein